MARGFTAREIAEHVGGLVEGDGEVVITGAATVAGAGPGQVIFVEGDQYGKDLARSRASAVFLGDATPAPRGITVIRVPYPGLAMAKALDLLYPRERAFRGVSPQATLGERVVLGDDVGVGPGVYLGDGVRVGRGTEIHPGATVGRRSEIGEDCTIYSGVHIYHDISIGSRVILHSGVVIGGDGYGFLAERTPEAGPADPARHKKVLQVGRVVIEDDVEIGANTTIDRAALDATRIGRGTKIDNLVMIAHNVQIGRHSLIIAQVGIAGSTTVGEYVTIAGQAGVVGHIHIGARATVGAQAGVTKDVPEGQAVLGTPAVEVNRGRKALALIPSLPDMKVSLAALDRRLEALEKRNAGGR
jgi:UDP-3-O-[3-hydroxymyristoyl] glucosamine N-acyltransferase